MPKSERPLLRLLHFEYSNRHYEREQKSSQQLHISQFLRTLHNSASVYTSGTQREKQNSVIVATNESARLQSRAKPTQ